MPYELLMVWTPSLVVTRIEGDRVTCPLGDEPRHGALGEMAKPLHARVVIDDSGQPREELVRLCQDETSAVLADLGAFLRGGEGFDYRESMGRFLGFSLAEALAMKTG